MRKGRGKSETISSLRIFNEKLITHAPLSGYHFALIANLFDGSNPEGKFWNQ